MSDKTGLETQEDEVKVLLGKPTGINGIDKSMLEMSPTNRLIIDSRQSELQICVNLLHTALVKTDNRIPTYRKIKDSETQAWRTETDIVDHWKWLSDLDSIVRTNQLTIKGYSRAQHLRQSANQSPITVEDEQQNFLQKLFGGH